MGSANVKLLRTPVSMSSFISLKEEGKRIHASLEKMLEEVERSGIQEKHRRQFLSIQSQWSTIRKALISTANNNPHDDILFVHTLHNSIIELFGRFYTFDSLRLRSINEKEEYLLHSDIQ